MKQIVSIHCSLQHVTLVYQQGCTHLPVLSLLLSKFPNVHILHHIPSNWMHYLWWSCTLSIPNPSHSFKILPTLPLDVWVDAPISVGVSLLVDSHWVV